jgi:MFS transporter, PHS family, inorganic phosphate transporter
MLATVFYAQPIGQLVACIVAVIVTASLRHGISRDASPTYCVGECLHATEKIWRWIVGFGAIPPAFAVLLRFYIPESPRYLLEVERDPMGIDAADYPRNKYYGDPLLDEEEGGNDPSTGNDHHEIMNADGLDENGVSHRPRLEEIPHSRNGTDFKMQYARPTQSYLHTPEDLHNAPSGSSAPSRSTMVDPLDETEGIESSPRIRPATPRDLLFKRYEEVRGTVHRVTPDNVNTEKAPVAQDPSERASSHFQDSHTNNAHSVQVHRPGKESWKAFWRGFRVYLFTDRPWTWQRLGLCLRFKDKHFFDGNWTDLAGTASTWFLLDFAFYFSTVNSPKLISKIWDAPAYTVVYPMLIQYAWRALISTSIGAVIGGAIFIAVARYRRNLQLYGFMILAGLFVIVGIAYIELLGGHYFAAIIVLYCACNLFFDFGPNTSTFVVSTILLTKSL